MEQSKKMLRENAVHVEGPGAEIPSSLFYSFGTRNIEMVHFTNITIHVNAYHFLGFFLWNEWTGHTMTHTHFIIC